MKTASISYIHKQILQAITTCEHVSDLKIVLAPSNHAALSIRTALARSGTALINIEAVTPSGLARHIWRAVHPEDGFRFMGRSAAEFVLGALVEKDSQAEGALLQGSIGTVYDAIQLDKEWGRTPKELFEIATTPIQQSYAKLFEEYANYISTHGRLDEQDIRQIASESLLEFASQRHVGLVAVCDLVELSKADLSLISELGDQAFKQFLIGSGERKGASLPNWGYPKVENPFPILSSARRGVGQQGLFEASPIQLIQAGTRREEVRSVLADIMANGIPFDQVEVAYTDGKAYLNEIASACERFGIPWSSTSKRFNGDGRLVQLVRSYSDWILSGCEVNSLVRMIRNRYLDVSHLEKRAGDIASALEAVPVKIGKMIRPELWSVIEEKASGRGIDSDSIHSLKLFAERISVFIAPQNASVSEFGAVVCGLVSEFASSYSSFEIAQDFWKSHFSLGTEEERLKTGVNWVAKRVIRGLPSAYSAHEYGLSVLSIKDAGYGSAQKVYVLGLDDQASSEVEFSTGSNSGIIPLISQEVESTSRVSNRMVAKELLRRYGPNLVLSVPSFDVGADRPLFPSSALIELTGITKLNPSRPKEWLDKADYYAGRRDFGFSKVFPALQNGLQASVMRASNNWTDYDGVVSVPKQWRLEKSSPSKLETLASCPYRYFLSNVLRLKAPGPQVDDWMTKMEEGTLLHSLFEKHTRNRIKHKVPVSARDSSAMKNELEEHLSHSVQLADGGSEALLERKKKELGDSITLFLRHEIENQPKYQPVAVEFSFGDFEDSDTSPCLVPLTAGPLSLSGRIDRLDVTEKGEYVITDYKTGSFKGYASKELQLLTVNLQWAFYSLMVSKNVNTPVEHFEYFFPSQRGAGLTRSVAAPTENEVVQILEDLSERYNKGTFIQAAGEKICEYCEYQDICGDLTLRKREMQSKFFSPNDTLTPIFSGWKFRSNMKGDL